jgi:hypothetical protein
MVWIIRVIKLIAELLIPNATTPSAVSSFFPAYSTLFSNEETDLYYELGQAFLTTLYLPAWFGIDEPA